MKLLTVLKRPTKVCPICNKEITRPTLLIDSLICHDCLSKMKVIMKSFKVEGVKALALYNYNSDVRGLIYQYKGLNDLMLQDIFLSPFLSFLKAKYKNYTICYPPSFSDNHNAFLFSSLNLKMQDLFYKEVPYKQSSMPFEKRHEISKVIKLKNKPQITSYLLVDDVMTSGETIKACIKLLKDNHVKQIKVLLISLNNHTLD